MVIGAHVFETVAYLVSEIFRITGEEGSLIEEDVTNGSDGVGDRVPDSVDVG